MYKLFDLVANNQGKRELKILVKSKLGDIELDTGFKVSNVVEERIEQIQGAYIVA
jgi:DNA polymerase-3 subunit alpha